MVAQIDKTYKSFGFKRVSRRLFCYIMEGRPLTTRGRAINPLVRAFLAFFSGFFAAVKIDRPIFIVGMGRSGTTFLGNAMSVHPQVAYLNEPKLMWSMAFPEDDLVGNYVLGRARYRMDERCVTVQGCSDIRAMYALCASMTFSPRIVDKYPEMIFRIPFLKAVFPDAKFVAIVRSGHNVMKSVASWNRRNELVRTDCQENWWGLNDRKWIIICEELLASHPYFRDYLEKLKLIKDDAERSAIEWILTMEEIDLRSAEMGNSLLVVRYEDLMSNHQEVVDRIMQFCGLGQDRSILDYVEAEMDFSPDVALVELPAYIKIRFDRMLERFGYQ